MQETVRHIETVDAAPFDPGFGLGKSALTGLSLVDFLRVLRVRWRMIAGAAIAVVTLTIVVLFQITPLYSASAVVMLDQRKNNVEDVSAVLSGLPTDEASIQNQVQILTSRQLAWRVIDKLHLDQDPEFNTAGHGFAAVLQFLNPMRLFQNAPAPDAADIQNRRDAVIDKFLDHLAVDPVGVSTAIGVTFDSTDPAKAARICNAIADAYVEDQLNAKFEATQKATQWLADRIQELSRQSQAAAAAVQQYKAANGITETADGTSLVDQQMADISGQLILAKSDLAEKEATFARVSALARAGRAADVSQVVDSPLIAQLRGQETDLLRQEAELSSKYGPRHPKMLDLESQKANLESKISEEVQRVVQTVANDVAVAQAHVGSLQASLQQLEAQSAQQNQSKVRLSALESAAASAQSMYQAFLAKLNQTQGQEGIQTPDARVISRAEVPASPSFPKKTLVVGAAIPCGIILGLMLAFLAERLDSGFRTPSQLESLLGLPVLATVPEVKATGKGAVNAADRLVDKPMSSFAEAIRGLQLGLTLSNVDRKPKVILVTSSVPGEGKTTLAVSLGRLAAAGGLRTIVLDGDLRRPNVINVIGAAKPEHGIIEALAGTSPLDQCLVKDTKSEMTIIPCARRPANPSDLLASDAMQRLVETLRRACDLLIIDSAPVLPVNDTKILSQLADAVLFAVRWEATPREAVANAMRALRDVHAPVVGFALARADSERFRYYSYGYQNYYNYNKYYSD